MANDITILENELIDREPWYQTLIDECKDIIIESEFTARWTMVEAWHMVGQRILQDEANFTQGGYTLDGLTQRVATSLDRSQRTIEYAIQFAKTYPVLNDIPMGKEASWHSVCKLLSTPKGGKKQKEEFILCKSCGSEIMPLVIKCRCGCEFEFKKEEVRRR